MQLIIIFLLDAPVCLYFWIIILFVHGFLSWFGLDRTIKIPITLRFIIFIPFSLHFLLKSFLLNLLIQMAEVLNHFVTVVWDIYFLTVCWVCFRGGLLLRFCCHVVEVLFGLLILDVLFKLFDDVILFLLLLLQFSDLCGCYNSGELSLLFPSSLLFFFPFAPLFLLTLFSLFFFQLFLEFFLFDLLLTYFLLSFSFFGSSLLFNLFLFFGCLS